MTKRDWLSVGLKVAGVSIAMMLLAVLLQLGVGYVQSDVRGHDMPPILAGLLAGALLSLSLVLWGDALAARLAPAETAPCGGESLACQRDAFMISLRVIGAVWLTLKVIEEARWIVSWGYGALDPLAYGGASKWLQISIATVILVLAISLGLYLLFGGKWLVRFAFRGTAPDASDANPDHVIMGIGPQDVVFSLALRVVGVLLFLRYLPGVVTQAISFFPIAAESRKTSPNWERILWYLVFVAISIYLITGAKGLVRLVYRRARAGNSAGNQGAS